MSPNLRGIVMMTVSMAAFAVEDACIKAAAMGVPAGQILMTIGAVGGLAFLMLARAQGNLSPRALLDPTVVWRNAAEMLGTLGFVTALTMVPLATVTAILQAGPLLVVAGAALFLGERVGWRRWSAVAVGFAGVLVILRPGAEGFDLATLWAVAGVLGLAVRDLLTRRLRPGLPTALVAASAFLAVAGLGAVMLGVSGGARVPSPAQAALMAGAVAAGFGGYWALIEATRAGDVAVISPFRYARLVFALIIAVVVFAERPGPAVLIGAALVMGSGLYTLYRERLRR